MRNFFLFSFFFFTQSIIYAQCWEKISISSTHSLAIKIDGTLWAWGKNEYSQLGNGSTINSSTPIQIGIDNDWLQISAGIDSSIALKSNGTIWSWGNNNYGQLGHGTFVNINYPTQIGTESDWIYITESGSYHYAAIKSSGTLWCWGFNINGQLGDGTLVLKNIPTQISNNNNWTIVSTGAFTTHAIKTDGTLWGWGNNTNGQVGDGTTTNILLPVQIGIDTNWTNVVGAYYHTSAIKNNHTIWSWGLNNYGQLGIGNTINKLVPTLVDSAMNWQKISAGGLSNLAIKTNGTLWSWGYNVNGQLGNGTTINEYSPVQIGTDTNWQNVFVNGYRAGALNDIDLNLYNWGINSFGQLGDGTTVDKLVPTSITCNTLETDELSNNQFILYPNPTMGNLFLQFTNSIDNATAINLFGQRFELKYMNNQINTEDLINGLYILEINSEGRIYYKKFQKL